MLQLKMFQEVIEAERLLDIRVREVREEKGGEGGGRSGGGGGVSRGGGGEGGD